MQPISLPCHKVTRVGEPKDTCEYAHHHGQEVGTEENHRELTPVYVHLRVEPRLLQIVIHSFFAVCAIPLLHGHNVNHQRKDSQQIEDGDASHCLEAHATVLKGCFICIFLLFGMVMVLLAMFIFFYLCLCIIIRKGVVFTPSQDSPSCPCYCWQDAQAQERQARVQVVHYVQVEEAAAVPTSVTCGSTTKSLCVVWVLDIVHVDSALHGHEGHYGEAPHGQPTGSK